MCASVVDDALLDKLRDAAKYILALQSNKESQIIIAGILFVRKGDIIGSLGSANRITYPYQVIGGGQSYYTWSQPTRNTGDMIIRYRDISPGIHI